MRYQRYKGILLSLLISTMSFILITSAHAGPGRQLGKLLRDAYGPKASTFNTSPKAIRSALEAEYGKSPFGVGPLLRIGKVPRYDVKILDLRHNQIERALNTQEFNAELRRAVQNARPNDVPIDADIENKIYQTVSDVVQPAILKVLQKRPDIGRKIWEHRGTPSELRFISDELVSALSVAPKEKDVLLKISASPSGVYFEFAKGIRIGRTDIRLAKIEVIKPLVIAAGIALCINDQDTCSDEIGVLIEWFHETKARALSKDAEEPINQPGGGIKGAEITDQAPP